MGNPFIVCNECNDMFHYEQIKTAKKCFNCNKDLNIFKDDNIYLIPFAFNEENCREIFLNILMNEMDIPIDIFECISDIKFEKIYIPVFMFDGDYFVDWHASSGYNKTIHYTEWNQSKGKNEKKTRIETEWKPSHGKVKGRFSVLKGDYETPAIIDFITSENNPVPFQIFDIDKTENTKIIDINEIKSDVDWNYVSYKVNLRIDVPGDTYKDLQQTGTLNNIKRKIIYYPIYKVSYKYKNDLYIFDINADNNHITNINLDYIKNYKFPKASLKDNLFTERKQLLKKQLIYKIIGFASLFIGGLMTNIENKAILISLVLSFFTAAFVCFILWFKLRKVINENKKKIDLFFIERILEKYNGFENFKKESLFKFKNIVLNYDLIHIKAGINEFFNEKQKNDMDNLINKNSEQIESGKLSNIKIERIFKKELPIEKTMNLEENSKTKKDGLFSKIFHIPNNSDIPDIQNDDDLIKFIEKLIKEKEILKAQTNDLRIDKEISELKEKLKRLEDEKIRNENNPNKSILDSINRRNNLF